MITRSAILSLVFSAPILHAGESQNRLGINYLYFQNDVNNVTATPNTLSFELSRDLNNRITVTGSVAIPSSDSSASETYFVNQDVTNYEYTASINQEIQLSAEIYLFDKSQTNFNPYLNLGLSSVDSDLQVDITKNGSLISSTSSDNNTSGFVYGAGFRFSFFQNWGLKAEYLSVAHDDVTNASKLSFGIHRRI